MRSILRTALTWMLLLALPVQGMAASAMLACGPSHHRQPPAAAAPHDHASHRHDAHDAQDASVASSQTHAPDHAAQASPEPLTSAKHGASKCSACASCCSSPALLAALPAVAAAEAVAADYPSLSSPHRGFLTGVLERPPRSFLA